MIGERYQTLGTVGKGVFSIVIKCQDMRAKEGESDRGNWTEPNLTPVPTPALDLFLALVLPPSPSPGSSPSPKPNPD